MQVKLLGISVDFDIIVQLLITYSNSSDTGEKWDYNGKVQ
jgi:hypothetical protein